MYFKVLFVPFALVYADFKYYNKTYNVGEKITYTCTYNRAKDWYARLTLTTLNIGLDVFFEYYYYNINFRMTVHEFDSNLLVTCNQAVRFRIAPKSSQAVQELFDTHVYSDGDEYNFFCSHDGDQKLYWIKVDGNNTVQLGRSVMATQYKEVLNLSRSDNNTRLYCFSFKCTKSTSMDCTRIILKTVKLQLKIDHEIENTYTPIFISLIISFIIIIILSLIICWLLKSRNNNKDDNHLTSQDIVQEEVMYVNLNNGNDDPSVEYVDLDLVSGLTNEINNDNAPYTQVTHSKKRKKKHGCF